MMRPLEITLNAEGTVLAILWEDGSRAALPAALLRASCRSAPARRRRLEGDEQPPADLTITGLAPVGHYAVNLTFSDGHARGIYPWPYLRALAAGIGPEEDQR